MIFAYADPPYLGCAKKLYGDEHYDSEQSHRELIEKLVSDFPDGWALSLASVNLRVILPMTPDDCRIAAWVKPFAVFRPNVNPAYAWEPVIFRGGRNRGRFDKTIRDFHVENIAMQRGLPGAKPDGFPGWIADLLGADPREGDSIVDLFPGTGGCGMAFSEAGL